MVRSAWSESSVELKYKIRSQGVFFYNVLVLLCRTSMGVFNCGRSGTTRYIFYTYE